MTMMRKQPSNRNLRLEPGEFVRLTEESGFADYYLKATDFFYAMKPGQSVRLAHADGNRLRWLVKTACAFVLEGENWSRFRLDDDFTRLTKVRE